MFTMNEQTDVKVKSLGKALGLLDFFTQECPERGISELAELSGLLKSSVHNMISTFEACGFVEKNQSTGKYRLGVKILRLSNSLYLSHDLRNLLRPRLEELSSAANENVYLTTLDDDKAIYVDAIYPPGRHSGRSIIGIDAPLHCTGVGKAIMAELDADHIDRIIARGLVAFTPNTIADGKRLRKDLAVTRSRGYAIDDMEHEFGIRCVAVAIKNIKGNVAGSVSISGPAPRITDERVLEFATMLKKVAEDFRGLVRR